VVVPKGKVTCHGCKIRGLLKLCDEGMVMNGDEYGMMTRAGSRLVVGRHRCADDGYG
jgi:hypothetical protein